MTGADPEAEIAELMQILSRVADGLYRIDADPECRLLRERDALDGVSASLAVGVADAFDRVWVEYPLATQAAEGATGNKTSLLSSDFPARVRRLDDDVRRILAAAAKISEAWRTALPRVDELRKVLAAVGDDSTAIGMGDDADLVHARRLVDHLAQQIARDPLSVDSAPATRAVGAVADRIGDLARMHASIGSDLQAARTTLAQIRTTITEGRDALARTRERIANPGGLLAPLDERALDAGDLALGPWLERLDAEAAAGRWLPAALGLDRWRTVAEGWLVNAQRVAAANRAPVAQRNNLRGLLDAYRAKAAATGKAEDRTLTAALQHARAALFTAPCDLEEADRLVQDYARLVSDDT